MTDISQDPKPMFSDAIYNFLKTLVQLWLPALATLYFTLAAIWGFPNAEQVVGTIAALTTFLGVALRISTKTYENSPARFDGTINVGTTGEGTKLFTLELNRDPNDLERSQVVVFKVTPFSE